MIEALFVRGGWKVTSLVFALSRIPLLLALQLPPALVVLRGRAQLLDSRATLSGGALDPTSGANSGVLGSVSRPSVPLGDITATSTSAPMSASTSQRGAAGQEAADKALFVYGTLMNEEVLFALLGRVPTTKEASLAGYHRYRIKDHVYPAIRPKEGGSVMGLFMPGLNAREKLIFDIFEDDDYHKVDVEVEVRLDPGSEKRMAAVYVWNASKEDQLYSTWEPSVHFANDGEIVRKYVKMVQGFSNEILDEGLLEEEAVIAEGETA